MQGEGLWGENFESVVSSATPFDKVGGAWVAEGKRRADDRPAACAVAFIQSQDDSVSVF